MKRNSSWSLVFALAVLIVGWVTPNESRCQSSTPSKPVTERDRPAVDPQGVRLGGFTLYPVASLEGRHDDNILADDSNPIDDVILELHPELDLRSNWSRHALNVGVAADIARYTEDGRQDYDDFFLWTSGRLDTAVGQLSLEIEHADTHESRESNDDARGFEPTQFTQDSITASFTYRPGRLAIKPTLAYTRLEYEDVVGPTGIINNTDRDRDYLRLSLRAAYQVHPAFDIFLEGRQFDTDYEQQLDDFGFARSSTGTSVVAGSGIQVTGKLFGEFYAGYRDREFDEVQFTSADGSAFGTDLTWNATGLTTLNLAAERRIDATAIAGAADLEVTEIGVTVDHELRRNLILSLTANSRSDRFEGIDREDDLVQFRFLVRYLMNRRLHVQFGLSNDTRQSNGLQSGREYDITRFFIRFAGQV